jgi:hypothetical protein
MAAWAARKRGDGGNLGREPALIGQEAVHPCSVDGCYGVARRGGLCWGHVKRRTRKQTVNVLLVERPRSIFDRLQEAAITYCELKPTDDVGFERARDRLRKAAIAYARSVPSEKSRE